MNDFKRISDNVESMISQKAPPDKIRQYLNQEGLTSDQFRAKLQAQSDLSIPETMVKYSAGSGVANLIDSIPRAAVGLYNLGRAAYGVTGHALGMLNADQMPDVVEPKWQSPANILFRKAGIINDVYAPTTAGGKVGDFVTQAITGGGLNPAQLSRNISKGLIKPVVRDIVAPTVSGAGAAAGNLLTEDVNTGNESLDNLVKIGATLAGGVVPGGTVAARGTAGDRAAAALNGVSPDILAKAKLLKAQAIQNGTPLTDYEAIQAISGLNQKMQTQQRLGEQSDAANTTLTPIMQSRPKGNSIMFNKAVDSISPEMQDPQALAGLLKKSAEQAIKEATDFRTQEASPNYRAQRSSDAEAMNLIDANKSIQNKIEAGTKWKNDAIQQAGRWYQLSHEMGNRANDIEQKNLGWAGQKAVDKFVNKADEYKGATIDAVNAAKERQSHIDNWLNDLNISQDKLAEKNLPYISGKVGGFIKNLDSQIRVAGPTEEAKILQSFRDQISPNGENIVYPSQLESIYKSNRNKLDLGLDPTPEQKTLAGVLGPHVKNLDDLIQEVSPDIKQGRKTYAEISKKFVDPIQQGQIGKLARSDDFKTQSSEFLPDAPADITPTTIRNNVSVINAQEPDIIKQFLAQDLRRKYNEASQKNIGGENVYGGAKFAANVAGNPMQNANLIQAIKSSGGDVEPFQTALDIYRAQGYRPPVNSATASNLNEEAKGLGFVNDALTRPTSAIGNFVNNFRNGGATEDIAKAISRQDPTGELQIVNLARANGVYDPMKQQMLINLLLSNPQKDQ